MAGDSGKKLFVGPRFRRIRQQLGLSQTQIAEGLGVSPSYINLIERNQRPVTAQILLRLAETYDLDLRDLATADEDRFFAELNEIFSDPLFRQIDLPKQELRDLAELCPGVTHSLQAAAAAVSVRPDKSLAEHANDQRGRAHDHFENATKIATGEDKKGSKLDMVYLHGRADGARQAANIIDQHKGEEGDSGGDSDSGGMDG